MRRFLDAVRVYFKESDVLLLILSVVSSLYGLLLIISATRGTSSSQVYVQTFAIVLGVIFYVLISLIDVEIIADKYKALLIIGALFISTLFIWGESGDTVNRAWLRFSFGFGVQPAEFVKIPFIIIIARMISSRRDRRMLNSMWSMTRIIGVFVGMFMLIMLASDDLGSALVYAFILITMLFMGGVYLRWFALGAAIIGAASPLIWTQFLSERQKELILVLFDPSRDPESRGVLYQTTMGRNALALGRFTGQGLFSGRYTQTELIPKQHTDFIVTAAGEELGFLGVVAIFALLLALIVRCLYVGVKSNDKLGMLVCTGVAAMLIFQTLENLGMCLGLTPVIGITLPFFSYGGSSILTSFIAMGLVSGVRMRPKPGRY